MPEKTHIIYDRLPLGSNGRYVVGGMIPWEQYHLLVNPGGLDLGERPEIAIPHRSWEPVQDNSFRVDRVWVAEADCAGFVQKIYDNLPFEEGGTLVIAHRRGSQLPGGGYELGAFCCSSPLFTLGGRDGVTVHPPWAALDHDGGTKTATVVAATPNLWERLSRDDF